MPTPPPAHMPAPHSETDRHSASGGRDAGKVSFSGLAEPCAIGSLVEVVINAQGATQGSVLVEAIAPTGKVHRCQVHQRGNTFTATFTPNEVGEWQIAIMYDSEHIRGSPFVCHVYDANLVRVYGLDVGVVGQELKFNINTTQAGRGDIQVQVSHHGRSIPCYQEKQGPHLYRVQFTPDGAGHYKIHVYFNNMEVKGSPFSLDIVDASSVSVYGDNLRMASVDKLATFMIHAVGADSKDLTVTINAPSGKKKRARVVPMGDSTYRVEWKPVEAGEHYIDVRLYNQSVQDGPFSCNVGDPELVTVRNMPSHLKHTDLGEPQTFEIDASAAGSGNLEILINGGRVSCKVKELGNRLYLATFVPVHPVTHIVEMRFNGEPVKGSPWRIEVSLPSGTTDTQANVSSTMMTAVGAPAGFPLGSVILAAPIGAFPGGASPHGANYAAYLTTAPPNFQGTPNPNAVTTTFTSEIERVSDSISGGAGVVGPMWAEIEGRGLTTASVGKLSSFEIGGRGLNVDDIEVRVTGPNGRETPARVIAARTGNFRCEYVTTDVGTYRLEISFAGQPVTGSPFYVNSYAPQRVFIDPIPGGAVGQPVQFFVDANEAGKGQLEISINQGRVPNNVQMQGSGRCLVTFIPENVGTYIIDVTFNGELVRGCPIRVEIYDQDPTTGHIEHRQIVADSATSSRFVRPRQQSPGRSYSPPGGASAVGGHGATSTYTNEKREYTSTQNNQTNGDRGIHTSSVSYYLPGQPVTVHLPPVGAAGPHPTSVTTSTNIPQAPPPPPPAPVGGAKILTKSWQHKSTPTEPSTGGHAEVKRFESLESKKFETIPISVERKHADQQHQQAEYGQNGTAAHIDSGKIHHHTDQEPRNGSGIYDRGVSPPSALDHKKQSAPIAVHPYRPRITETTSVIEDHREEYSAIRTHRTSPPSVPHERSRDYDEIHRPATDRFYKYDTDHYDPQGRKIDESKHEFENRKFDDRQPSFEERLRKFEDKPEDDRSIGRRFDDAKHHEDERSFGGRKYFERQQTPTRSSEDASIRSEFDEQLGRRASDHTPSDLSRSGVTTVASYGVGPSPASSTLGYRRLGTPETGLVAHVLKPERELVELPVGVEASGHRGPVPTGHMAPLPGHVATGYGAAAPGHGYTGVEGLPKTKEAQLNIHVTRDIPAKSDIHVTREVQLQHGSPEASASWSGSSADELHEDEFARQQRSGQQKIDNQRHLGTGTTKERKFDIGEVKVEFPEALDAGGGVAVVRVRKPAFFEIKPALFDINDLKVNIITPSKSSLEHHVRDSDHGLMVEYTPTEVGTHKVHLQIRNETLFQSPYVVKVYDADRIQVNGIESGTVGNPVQFTVDATNAGYGSLEIAIKDREGDIIPSKVSAVQDSTSKFNVSFVPKKSDSYGIHVSFNQENLKGSPFVTNIRDAADHREMAAVVGAPAASAVASQMASEIMQQAAHSPPLKHPTNGFTETTHISTSSLTTAAAPITAPAVTAPLLAASTSGPKLVGDDQTKEKLLKLAPVGKTASMLVTGVEKGSKPKADVKGPNGKSLHTQVVDIGGGAHRIEFGPSTVGDHVIDVRLGDMHVQGSPFTCRVYDARKIKVGEIPQGSVGKPVHFVVDAGEAGVGNLEVAVNEGRIPSMAHGLGQHRYDISFVPKESIDHTISVRFNNEPVPGSPFFCKIAQFSHVAASGPGLERVPVRKPVSFTVEPQGAPHESLHVTIKDTTGQEVPARITGSSEKAFKVEYTPQVVGNHTIDIRYGNTPIQHSPFTVKAYDSSRVKLLPVEGNVAGKPCSFYIDAAKAGAGNMEIIVSVDGRNVPNFVTPEGNAKFKVSFTPQEPKQHVVSVKFNGEAVPGSPMTCSISDDQAFLVVGEGLSQAVLGKPTSFVVHAAEGSEHDCNVVITAPSQKTVPYQISRANHANGGFNVQFTPMELGPHSITVEKRRGAPTKDEFRCNVFDPSKVKVPRIRSGIVGQPLKIAVDVSKAGDGSITAEIKDIRNKLTLPCQLVSTTMGSSYDLICTPTEATTLSISVQFNGVDIPGSPFCCEVVDLSIIEAETSGLSLTKVDQPARFTVNLAKDGIEDDLVINILDPSKRITPFTMIKSPNDPSKFLVEFTPKEVGSYLVDVLFAEYPISDSPFNCEVFDIRRVRVSDLKNGHVGREQNFKVDCTRAGKGYLDIFLKTKTTSSRLPLRQLQDGLFTCSFIPKIPGSYSIEISFNGTPLPRSPFEVLIRDTSSIYAQGDGLQEAAVQKIAHFTVFLAGAGRGELDVVVTAPDGGAVPVKCFQQKDGNFRVEYSPNQVGTHHIDITFGDHPITGSPYTCEVFDPARIAVQSEAHGLSANQPTAIRVNRKNAGTAALAVQVTDPNGKLLSVEVVPLSHNEDEIRFTPITPGQHHVSVTYGGYDVANSPIPVLFNVDEPNMPSAYGDGLSRAVVNDLASFVVDVKKLKGELKVDVVDHAGQRAKHSVRKKGEGLYETTFTPTQPGHYVVTLLWNNKPLAGSPFSVSVLDPHKILVGGASTDRPEGVPIRVGVSKEVKIDASDAGPGKLRAEVRGPSGKLQTKVEEFGRGHYIVSFTPLQEGEHTLYIFWSDVLVPLSPATYWAERGAGSAVAGLDSVALAEASRSKDGVKRHRKEGDESPSIGKEHASGRGELTAQCVGPNKLAYCELYGRHDGTYSLHFRPLEPGRHNLHVKYDGDHVPGSPFPLNVHSPPDASKVRVYGPGVEHGILSKFKSDFSVDTQGAGAGQLTVRVRGPKAAFNVEMVRESKYDRLIRCKYDPKEPGDYQIEVKWAGDHVPGSPFLVMIFDTQAELERFLAGQPVIASPPLPFLPPGWVGPPPAGFMLPSPGGGHPPPALMMPPSPVIGYRPSGPRALTYGGPPPFPVYAGGSPRHQNGF